MNEDMVADIIGEVLCEVGRLHGGLVGITLRVLQKVLTQPQQLVVLAIKGHHPQRPIGFRIDEDKLVAVGMIFALGVNQQHVGVADLPAGLIRHPQMGTAGFRVGGYVDGRQHLLAPQGRSSSAHRPCRQSPSCLPG